MNRSLKLPLTLVDEAQTHQGVRHHATPRPVEHMAVFGRCQEGGAPR